jgi:dipeptidyl aminopeptidase/acylaminoacyl peptidase
MATIRDHLAARVAFPLGWSDDGERLLVQSNLTGTLQLFELADGALRQLTDEKEPVTGRFLPASDRVLVARDEGGNERLQLYTLAPDGGLEGLVVDPAWMHVPGGVSRDGRLLAYTTNRRNGTDFDVVVRDLETGVERVAFGDGGYVAAAGFSPDGRWLAVHVLTDKSGDDELYLCELAGGARLHVTPHDDESSTSAPAWLPDSSACFVVTDVGRDVPALARYDLATGSWSYVLDVGWELECAVDHAGTHLLVAVNEDGWTRAELRDPATLELQAPIELPGRGVASSWTFSDDGRQLAFHFTSARVPGDVWVLDTETGSVDRATDSPCGVDLAALAEPELHHVTSFDGESIPVFLLRPASGAGDAPVVVHVHGGPEAQARPVWVPMIGALVERGFAVAIPNVRGSSGYGKRYQHLDDRRRRLDSVRDLECLHGWLRETHGLDADRAALVGGSYGGYMVLAGLTFQPELWAAGVDVVGISSLVTFLENTSSYRRRVREREYGFLDVDRDFLVEASPLTHVDRLRAPLFLIHGANDPRVPLSEAEQLHATLAAKGIATELLVYPDEGHGLQKLVNRLDAYPKAMDFLVAVLGV